MVMDDIESVCDFLYEWHTQGRGMPGYVIKKGKPFLLMLLANKTYNEWEARERHISYWLEEFSPYETQLKALVGPNGWAYLKILMHRAEERRAKDGSRMGSTS